MVVYLFSPGNTSVIRTLSNTVKPTRPKKENFFEDAHIVGHSKQFLLSHSVVIRLINFDTLGPTCVYFCIHVYISTVLWNPIYLNMNVGSLGNFCLFVFCLFVYLICLICLFFFFSSRRRHTRYWSDWSSDVCSSDLVWLQLHQGVTTNCPGLECDALQSVLKLHVKFSYLHLRSEERRVGKECRSRWSPYH